MIYATSLHNKNLKMLSFAEQRGLNYLYKTLGKDQPPEQAVTEERLNELQKECQYHLGGTLEELGIIYNTCQALQINGYVGAHVTDDRKTQLVLSDQAFDVMMLASLLQTQANNLLRNRQHEQIDNRVLVSTPDAQTQFNLINQLNTTNDYVGFNTVTSENCTIEQTSVPTWRQAVLLS